MEIANRETLIWEEKRPLPGPTAGVFNAILPREQETHDAVFRYHKCKIGASQSGRGIGAGRGRDSDLPGAGRKQAAPYQSKQPHIKGWQEKATTDPAQLRRWWRKWPDAMPAIPTGTRSGIAVLDLDRKNGKDGFQTLRELGHDPDALSPHIITTPSGGQHLYFRHMEGLKQSAGQIGPGVDVRAEGSLVIAPGAINGKGT